MEENKNAAPGKGQFILAYVILTALICVGAGFGLMFPSTALLAACAVVFPWWGAFAPAACISLCAYLIYGSDVLSLLTIAFYVIIALVTGILLRKKAPCRITLLVVCILMLVFTFGINLLPPSSASAETVNGMVLISDAEMEAELASYGINVDAFLYSVLAFAAIIEGGFIFAFSRITSILLLLIPAFRGRERKDVVPFMAPFIFWMLSKNYTIGLITAACAVAAVNIIGLPNAEIITYVTITIFLTPIFVQGICFMRFLSVTLRKRGLGIVILLYTGCVLLMPFSFIGLGLCDQFMRIRARRVSISRIHIDGSGHSGENDSDENDSDSGEV